MFRVLIICIWKRVWNFLKKAKNKFFKVNLGIKITNIGLKRVETFFPHFKKVRSQHLFKPILNIKILNSEPKGARNFSKLQWKQKSKFKVHFKYSINCSRRNVYKTIIGLLREKIILSASSHGVYVQNVLYRGESAKLDRFNFDVIDLSSVCTYYKVKYIVGKSKHLTPFNQVMKLIRELGERGEIFKERNPWSVQLKKLLLKLDHWRLSWTT